MNNDFEKLNKSLQIYDTKATPHKFIFKDNPENFSSFITEKIDELNSIKKLVEIKTNYFTDYPEDIKIYSVYEETKEIRRSAYSLLKDQQYFKRMLQLDYKPTPSILNTYDSSVNTSNDIINSWGEHVKIDSKILNHFSPMPEHPIVTNHSELLTNLENFNQILEISVEVLKQLIN